MPAYFIYKEIGSKFSVSIIYTWVIAKKAVSYALKSTRTSEIQRDHFVENSPGQRFGNFFKSKLSPVSSLPWPMNKINSLKTHFYYVYTICRIDDHVDMKNTPAWYEHLSCSYCYQEDPSKSAVAQKVAHRSYVRCMNRSAHPIGFSCGPIRATWQGVDKVLASIYSVYICVDSRETRTFTWPCSVAFFLSFYMLY